ncbi:hypothetical protein D3C72_643880 [compost metagenome]
MRVGLIVVMATLGDTLQVVDDRLGGVAHLATQEPHAQAQIDVLVAVAVALVEAAGHLEVRPADEQACAGDHVQLTRNVHLGGVGRGPQIHVIGHHALIEGHAGMLDLVVDRVEQLGAHHRHGRIGLGRAYQCLEPPRHRQRVVVQQHHVTAASGLGALVAGGGEAQVLRVADDRDVAFQAGEQTARAVGGGVVDENHLEELAGGVGDQGLQAELGELDPVEDGNDDRGERRLRLRRVTGGLGPGLGPNGACQARRERIGFPQRRLGGHAIAQRLVRARQAQPQQAARRMTPERLVGAGEGLPAMTAVEGAIDGGQERRERRVGHESPAAKGGGLTIVSAREPGAKAWRCRISRTHASTGRAGRGGPGLVLVGPGVLKGGEALAVRSHQRPCV